LAEEGSAVDTSVAAEAFTLVALRWEDSNATVWAVLEESAIPLVRGQRTDDQSMSGPRGTIASAAHSPAVGRQQGPVS
jgi:hypothetical protein